MWYWLRCWLLLLLTACSWLICLPLDIALAQAPGTLFGLESQWIAGVRVTPSAQVGYQLIGLNFDLPIFIPNVSPPPNESLSLQFQDANVWIGALGLKADFPCGLSLILKGQANARRDIRVFTPQDSQGQGIGVIWAGNKLQWWTLDAGLAYPLRDDWSIVAGFRRDQLSVALSNPWLLGGVGGPGPINFFSDQIDFFSEQIQKLTYFGDVSSKLSIPYVGLRLDTANLRACFLWSPFVQANVKIPTAVTTFSSVQQFFGPPFFATDNHNFGFEYKVIKPAAFLEACMEYESRLSSSLSIGLWGRLSWVRLSGKGDFHLAETDVAVADGVIFSNFRADAFASGHASFNMRIVAGGLEAILNF